MSTKGADAEIHADDSGSEDAKPRARLTTSQRFRKPPLPDKKRKQVFDENESCPRNRRVDFRGHRRPSRHKAQRSESLASSTNQEIESEPNSSTWSSQGDSDQESKESSRGESDDFESSNNSPARDAASSDQGQSSGSSDQGQNSDQELSSGSNSEPITQRKRVKKLKAGHEVSTGSDQDSEKVDTSPSDITKGIFDEGPPHGSSDDSAAERIMNKSIESFSDTSSESHSMKASKGGKPESRASSRTRSLSQR